MAPNAAITAMTDEQLSAAKQQAWADTFNRVTDGYGRRKPVNDLHRIVNEINRRRTAGTWSKA